MSDLTELDSFRYFSNSIDNVAEYVLSASNLGSGYIYRFVYLESSIIQSISNSQISGAAKGICLRLSDTWFDFFLWQTSGGTVLAGRYQNGDVIALYRYNGTSVL